MRIDKKFKLWEITKLASLESQRPSLECIFIARVKPNEQLEVTVEDYPEWMVMPMGLPNHNNGVAIVTDGFILAVVPIIIEDDDVPGVFPGEVLQIASKKASVGNEVYIVLKKDEVIIPFLNQVNSRPDYTFPDVRNLIEDIRTRHAKDGKKCSLSIDHIRLAKLCKALGVKTLGNPNPPNSSVHLYALSEKDKMGMVLVTPDKVDHGQTIVPPFGLLMEVS